MAKEFLKVRSGLGIKPNSAPSDPDNGDIYYDSGTDLFKFRQGGAWSTISADTSVPKWTKYTIAHTDLQAPSGSNNITLFTLPAKTMLHKVILKHSTAFAGTGITSYQLSLGISGAATKYAANFDVTQVVSDNARSITTADDIESFSSGTSMLLQATANANLNQSTAGSVDIWIMTSLLP